MCSAESAAPGGRGAPRLEEGSTSAADDTAAAAPEYRAAGEGALEPGAIIMPEFEPNVERLSTIEGGT